MKQTLLKITVIIGLVSNIACSSMKSKSEYFDSNAYQSRQALKSDILGNKDGHLSETQLKSLLNSKIKLRDSIKIAVVKMGHSVNQRFAGYPSYPANMRQYATKTNTTVFENIIKKKGRIKDISYVPSILMPEDKGLRSLRDVAAVMQADLLLVIYTDTDSDYQFQLFAPNEVKATATLEAIAVDVKTGTIPFTSLGSGTVHETQNDKDFSSAEFRARAVIKAEDKALAELAKNMERFFN